MIEEYPGWIAKDKLSDFVYLFNCWQQIDYNGESEMHFKCILLFFNFSIDYLNLDELYRNLGQLKLRLLDLLHDK